LAANPHFTPDERNLTTPRSLDSAENIALIGRVIGGDQTALMTLYDRYSALVYSVSLHVLRSSEAAEDVTQDVFLRLWRKATLYNVADGSVAVWLSVMARHQAIDILRRKKRELRFEDGVISIEHKYSSVQDSSADVSTIRSILEKLPREQREILDLAYFGGLTHAEIASLTGKPLGTVKSRIRTALLSLRQVLKIAGWGGMRSSK
jgi:RNA polymerase sigma-70 factor (ECF subfamily)